MCNKKCLVNGKPPTAIIYMYFVLPNFFSVLYGNSTFLTV